MRGLKRFVATIAKDVELIKLSRASKKKHNTPRHQTVHVFGTLSDCRPYARTKTIQIPAFRALS